MLTAFVDESGDLGQHGTRFFVIALVIPKNKKRLKNIVKHHCAKNDIPEIKAAQLDFPQKQELLKKLSSIEDHTISYIVVDKQNITKDKLFEDKNLLYNYLFKWLIKPIIIETSEDIEIILDNHSTKVKSINSLCDYIKILAYSDWKYSGNINIQYKDSKESKIVQIADVIANTVYGKYLYTKEHLYSMLKIDRTEKYIDFFTSRYIINISNVSLIWSLMQVNDVTRHRNISRSKAPCGALFIY